MPTPVNQFLEIAAKYGEMDPADLEAIQHWYEQVLPTLPEETVDEVLAALLDQEGKPQAGLPERSYPPAAPLPRLGEAHEVSLPLLAAGWGALLRRLWHRRQP